MPKRVRLADGELSCGMDTGPVEVREYCQVDDAGRSLMGGDGAIALSG